MLYVYGIVRGGHPAPTRVRGIDHAPIEVLDGGPVAALVSAIDASEVGDEAARTHLYVLIAALDDGPVLPVRLGTVQPDEAVVRSTTLGASAPEYAESLDALDGLVEVQVDADDDEAAVLAELAPRYASFGASGDLADRIETGHRIAAAVMERRRLQAEAVVERLRSVARDDVARGQVRGPEDPVLRWAFLVARADLDRFDAAVAEVQADFPALQFRSVGPLPAAHFLDRRTTTVHQAADTFRGSGSWGW
ncbi:MAG: GvpL/GvpF family gas vesicle protein [Jatrophihabitans sp.]|uniref:GvpL/GvpF family gas vesicle protein n=1 Tax=Jatrophihabitans sp. TaxID=1932789 RepID=UPI003F7D8044